MRKVRISIDVFAEIWARRQEGETSEDQVLRRILGLSNPSGGGSNMRATRASRPSVRWVDDVVQAVSDLGGRASLTQIYAKVRAIRLENGRSTPPSLDEVVRKEIETHSSDSDVFQEREDYFWAPEGKGAGVWALKVAAGLDDLA